MCLILLIFCRNDDCDIGIFILLMTYDFGPLCILIC